MLMVVDTGPSAVATVSCIVVMYTHFWLVDSRVISHGVLARLHVVMAFSSVGVFIEEQVAISIMVPLVLMLLIV
jgi:hypothetical protein